MAVTPHSPARRAVFLDKDGTLIENVPYNVDIARIRFAAGAEQALPRLSAAGLAVVIVSNQAGVARGFFDETAVDAVGEALAVRLADLGVTLDGFYYCPHDPAGRVEEYRRACTCRKPAPGLLLRAADQLDIDLEGSWLVGDILDDVAAGRAAGCRTVLIDAGNETEWRLSRERMPDHVVADLGEAAAVILSLEACSAGARACTPLNPPPRAASLR